MKKVLAICLAVIFAVSTAAVAYARGSFVSSPSGNEAPEIVSVEYGEGSCEPKIVVTPYSDREELDEEREQDMEDAYNEISENEDVTELCPEVKNVAAVKGVDPQFLAISDLFDVTAYHKLPHSYCGTIKITLSAETIKNFVALIHRTKSGAWENIPDVVVDASESTITFSARDFSPFAVVVDTSGNIPDTGDFIYIPAIFMAVSAISLVGILISLKKKKQEA